MISNLVERPHAALDPKIVEEVLLGGDLSRLSPAQRTAYYNRVCETLGLNPLTQPFAYLRLNGKEVLYAKKDATEQLRMIHGVSITEISTQQVGDVFVVTAKATNAQGRTDASTGAVSIAGLKGEALANALMKAETKAKRRCTLSICGLGLLDETELDSVRQEVEPPIVVNTKTGEILTPPAQAAVAAGEGAMLLISPAQQKRFWAIARKAGWTDDAVKRWLWQTYQLESTTAIPRAKYDHIVTTIMRGPEGA